MNPAGLLAHFDRISDAPEAIPRLRLFILDLAVRGKLVEQDRRDEPASELLNRIQAEKLRLMKAKDITKEKPIPPLAGDDVPFLIPTNWCWTQLAKVGFINPRNTAPDELPASFVPMTLISAEYGVVHKHEVRSWAEIKSGYTHFAEGDVGLAKITPCFENRKSTVFRELTGGIGAGTTELHIIRPILANVDFLLIFLKSPYFIETGIPKMTGTAGQKRVPTDYFAYSPFPLPPLAEQHRIVTKVDELMALCDQLEAAQAERESRQDRLVASALHRLNNGADPDAFRNHARFYFNHLPRLTTRSEHIKQLRQAILNLAVRGKLVSQDSDEEPASELLKRIRAERTQLIESGKITKNEKLHVKAKPIPPDYCPSGWNWVRLRDVIWCYRGHNPPKSDFVTSARPGYVRFIQITDFKTDNMAVYVPITRHLKMVYRGEIIMAAYRHVGKVSRHVEGAFNVALCKVNEIGPMNRDFIELLIGTDLVRGELLRASERGHIPSMHSDHLLSLWVPIPPKLEQKRILEKYAELMSLCDRLEAQITTTQTESRRLLEAVLYEALAPALNKSV